MKKTVKSLFGLLFVLTISVTVGVCELDVGAALPAITLQPADQEVELPLGETSISVNVTVAARADGGTLNYQWYSYNTTAQYRNKTGTKIANATQATLTLQLKQENEGQNRYYVMISNTRGNATSSEVQSRGVTITLNIEGSAVFPIIKNQPLDTTIAKSATALNVVPLSVTAEISDKGTLSYQWYSNTSESNEGGTEIPDADERTYSPPFTFATPNGLFYYYVEITNTHPANSTTAKTTSDAVVYTITNEPDTVNNTATVDIGTKYQYVRGFGGTSLIWSNHTDDKVEDYEVLCGSLGLNMLRIMLPPDSTDIDDTMEKLTHNAAFPHVDGKYDRYGGDWWFVEKGITPPSPSATNPQGGKDNSDYYDLVKVVNKYDGYVFASPWSPPGAWKNNGTYRGTKATPGVSDHLLPEHYGDFANYLKRFSEIMYENGAPIYSVALQNEHTFAVDYEGCLYNATQHQSFWVTQGHYTSKYTAPGDDHYVSQMDEVPGWGGGREIPSVRPMSAEAHNAIEGSGDLGSVVENTANGNLARQGYDILARHIYGANTPTSQNFLNMAQFHPTDPKEVWQTEWSPQNETEAAYTWPQVWAMINAIDYTIRLCNESAFIWFPSKGFDCLMGDGSRGTVYKSPGDILPRGYGLSHFAKYAKETGRVGLTIGSGGATNINPTSDRNQSATSAQWLSPKMMAFVTLYDDFYEGPVESRHRRWRGVNDGDGGLTIGTLDINKIKAISLVMFTPTNAANAGGTDLGTVKIQLPAGFKIGRAEAIRSSSGNYHKTESVIIGADSESAFINLPASQMISVRFEKAQ